MRVRVIAERCQGHGRCYALAPEVFDSDELGNAVVVGDGTVGDDHQAAARLAADNCPEFAIEVDEG